MGGVGGGVIYVLQHVVMVPTSPLPGVGDVCRDGGDGWRKVHRDTSSTKPEAQQVVASLANASLPPVCAAGRREGYHVEFTNVFLSLIHMHKHTRVHTHTHTHTHTLTHSLL